MKKGHQGREQEGVEGRAQWRSADLRRQNRRPERPKIQAQPDILSHEAMDDDLREAAWPVVALAVRRESFTSTAGSTRQLLRRQTTRLSTATSTTVPCREKETHERLPWVYHPHDITSSRLVAPLRRRRRRAQQSAQHSGRHEQRVVRARRHVGQRIPHQGEPLDKQRCQDATEPAPSGTCVANAKKSVSANARASVVETRRFGAHIVFSCAIGPA